MEHVTVPGKQILDDYLSKKALMDLGRKPTGRKPNTMTVLQRPLFSFYYSALLTPK